MPDLQDDRHSALAMEKLDIDFDQNTSCANSATTAAIVARSHASMFIQAFLSSGAMYGGFMTFNRRKEIAVLAQEHTERIQVVRTLQGAVAEKDELMSVRLPSMESCCSLHALVTALSPMAGLAQVQSLQRHPRSSVIEQAAKRTGWQADCHVCA